MAIKKIKSDHSFEQKVLLPNETASRALKLDATGEVVASTVTETELEHLTGIDSNVQDQLDAKVEQTDFDAHLNDAVDAHDASAISNVPAGNIAATTVQDAINELDTEKLATADFGTEFDTAFAGKTTTDLAEGSNLYHTDERAQDAVGTILVDSSSVDFTYNDGTPSITAVVLPAGVDHDALANFVANEHVDHSAVQIATAANTSGLTGGGDITATRNLSVDINGTTAEATADNADKILIWDDSASALKSQTRSNFLAGVGATPGDIALTTFNFVDDQSVAANVTGLAFANASVRGFTAELTIERGTTYEKYTFDAIQLDASWEMTQESVGNDTGITFTITTAGQVQYTSTSTGDGGVMRFRAWAISF